MASDLVSYLIEDTVNERVNERVEKVLAEAEENTRKVEERARATEERVRATEERVRATEERVRATEERERFVHAVQDVLVARFPDTPVARAYVIGTMRNLDRLRDLHAALLRAPDQQAAEQVLRQAAG